MKRSLLLILLIMCAMYIVLSNVNYEKGDVLIEESSSISETVSISESSVISSEFSTSDL